MTFPVQAPASGITSGTTVGATLQATLTYAGNAVPGTNATPLSFRVVSAAQVSAVAGTGSPSRILRGRTEAPAARVANSGAASVTLSRGSTRLVLDRGGTTVAFTLAAATAVNAADQATLVFDSLAVPALTFKGRYRARLFLEQQQLLCQRFGRDLGRHGGAFVLDLADQPRELHLIEIRDLAQLLCDAHVVVPVHRSQRGARG